MTRRSFIKTGLIFVPTVASATIITPGPAARFSAVQSIPSPQPELADWISRVNTQCGSDPSAPTQAAVSALISGLKSDSLRSSILRMGIYAGPDYNACKAPLIKDAGASTDTLTGFISGDFSESTGLTGAANGKYIDTGLDASTLGTDSTSMGVYQRTNTAESAAHMGAYTDIDPNGQSGYILINFAGGDYCGLWDETNYLTSITDGLGLYVITRTASNSMKLYRNGIELADSATPSGTPPAANIWVHRRNGFGFTYDGSVNAFALYFVATGLGATQNANLYSRVQTFQTAMSRNV